MADDLLARVPRAVRSIADTLGRAGFGAWVVGGCVRDLLRGAEVADWDVATSARPEDVQKLFRRTIPTGIAHGTISVMEGKERYELTTLRGEGAYSDGRRPDSVHFVGSIEEDLARRDFTVNAIALDPRSGALVDPWGGQRDLEGRILRAVRDPVERFGEDGLRALRAARFVATLEMVLDPATEAAIGGTLATLAKVSKERVLAEWQKAIEKSRAPSMAFDVMRRTGMLAVLSPPIATLSDDAFARAMIRLDAAPRSFAVALAAMFLETEMPRPSLDGWLRDLKCSSADRERALHLALVLRDPAPASEGVEVRRWMKRVGRPFLDDAVALVRAEPVRTAERDALPARVDAELAAKAPLETKELAVRGEDLMKELGVPPSRKIGELLEGLLEDVLEDPSRNTRAALLDRARARIAGEGVVEKR